MTVPRSRATAAVDRSGASSAAPYLDSASMDVDRAITERRTTKRYTAEPVPSEVVRELVELAQWAPNHKLSTPRRFRLLGVEATQALVDIAPADKKPKMTLAPTRVLVSCKVAGDPTRRIEDLLATGAAWAAKAPPNSISKSTIEPKVTTICLIARPSRLSPRLNSKLMLFLTVLCSFPK